MKQIIARLRVLLHDAHEEGEIGGDAFHALAICAEANLPQLLDRLEALERVAEAAEEVFASPSMLLVERTVGFNQPHVNLKDALAALDNGGGG